MTASQLRRLLGALIDRDADAARLAVRNGADANASVNGIRPLHIAAIAGSRQMIQFLIDHGALPDGPDALGRTALHYAALGSARAESCLVDVLIQAGADVNAADRNGCKPLDLAAAAQNEPAATALIRAGAKCRPDRRDWTQRLSGPAARCEPPDDGPSRNR